MYSIPTWSRQCPQCGKEFEAGLGAPGYVRLGYELLECPNRKCRAVIFTGKYEWAHMTVRQKFGYFLSYWMIGFLVIGAGWVSLGLWMSMTSVPRISPQDRAELLLAFTAIWGGPIVVLALGKAVQVWRSLRRCPTADAIGPVRIANVHPAWLWVTGTAAVLAGIAVYTTREDEIWRFVFVVLTISAVAVLVKLARIGLRLRPGAAPECMTTDCGQQQYATMIKENENAQQEFNNT